MSDKPLDEYFADWEAHVFGYGYGTGEWPVLEALRRFLAAMDAGGAYDHRALEAALGDAVAWLLINTLARADVIEYGTSPRFGRLTPEGKRLKDYILGNDVERLYEIVAGIDHDYCYPDYCNCAGEPCSNPFWRRRTARRPVSEGARDE